MLTCGTTTSMVRWYSRVPVRAYARQEYIRGNISREFASEHDEEAWRAKERRKEGEDWRREEKEKEGRGTRIRRWRKMEEGGETGEREREMERKVEGYRIESGTKRPRVWREKSIAVSRRTQPSRTLSLSLCHFPPPPLSFALSFSFFIQPLPSSPLSGSNWKPTRPRGRAVVNCDQA